MKKLSVWAFAALLMLACSEKNAPENGGENQGGSSNPKEIACDPTLIEFDVSQDLVQTITLTASDAWSATTNVDWITIDPVSGQGDAFVKLSMKGGDVAEGKVIFSTGKASAQVIVRRLDKYAGSFSVSSTQKVYFSKGNLQYQASSDTWRFAEHQYDIIGEANKNISSTYSGWIDLFGWGTSGYGSKYPYMKSLDSTLYYHEQDIANTNYDWGVYNAISNGGNKRNAWRTLTINEWKYVFNSRKDASSKYSRATVNNKHGYILLPDWWTTPNGLSWKGGGWSTGWENNDYSISEWTKMEQAGAIFLPLPGFREGTTVKYIDIVGFYWSSSYKIFPDYHAFIMCVSEGGSLGLGLTSVVACSNGCAVRLVQDVK